MLREAEQIAQEIYYAKCIQMQILMREHLPPWEKLPYAEQVTLTRAVEEVLETRFTQMQGETQAAKDIAKQAEFNEEKTQDKYDQLSLRAVRVKNILTQAKSGPDAAKSEAIARALEEFGAIES